MKVEVEIPEGELCNDKLCCPFCVEEYEGEDGSFDNYCTLLKVGLKEDMYEVSKHPDCPSLKEEKVPAEETTLARQAIDDDVAEQIEDLLI